MDKFRKSWNQITARLGELTVSQRLAVGLCAALIMGSVLWLLQWSTTPDLVPLVSQEFSYEALDAAETALRANGIPYKIVGTRILVPVSDRHNALRLAHSANALPESSLFDMSSVVNDPNPFQPPESREFAQNYALGNELAKIIATYPFVRKASVLVNPRNKRRLGMPGDAPSASVAVILEPGHELSTETVEGFAKLVSGSVAGLQPWNVNIMDGRSGRSYTVPQPGDVLSFDYLGAVKHREAHLLSKIMTQLADIPGLRAQVTVELDTSKRVTQKQVHDAPQPKSEQTQSSEQTSGEQAAEPGVQANLGTAVTASTGGSSTSEQARVENFEPRLRETETVEHMPLSTRSVVATVSIPRSFIASLVTARFPDEHNPQDEDPRFVALRDEQMARVRSSVEKIIMARSPKDVEVDVYPDMKWTAGGSEWMVAPGEAVATREASTVQDAMGLLRQFGAPAGLAFLALMGMLMMLRLVRKSTDAAARNYGSFMTESPASGEEPLLSVGPHTVGQAAATEGLLQAREVDEQTLRYQELEDEVAKMVGEDPKGAASLLRRWIGAEA